MIKMMQKQIGQSYQGELDRQQKILLRDQYRIHQEKLFEDNYRKEIDRLDLHEHSTEEVKEIFELRRTLNEKNEILLKQTGRIHDLEKDIKDIKTRHLSLRDLHVYELE